MSSSLRKFIAILMLLWLPVFTGNALAASLGMQMAQGDCHEARVMQGAEMSEMKMSAMEMSEHAHAEVSVALSHDQQDSACAGCGVCHLACTGYLSAPDIGVQALTDLSATNTPYLAVFDSVSTAPLNPPPLARS